MATMRRGVRSTIIEHGCFRGLQAFNFALLLDRCGLRQVWLRGRENIDKRHLIHVAGYSLGKIMRLLTGAGTPRKFRMPAFVMPLAILKPDEGLILAVFAAIGNQSAAFAIWLNTDPFN
jgi:transposase